MLLCTVLQFLVSFISSVGVFAERTIWPLSTLCSVKQAQPASPPASQSAQPATTQAQLNQAAESERPTHMAGGPTQPAASQPARPPVLPIIYLECSEVCSGILCQGGFPTMVSGLFSGMFKPSLQTWFVKCRGCA